MWAKRLAVILIPALYLALAAEPLNASVRYRMPVDGVVVDKFRPPTNPYGPGNRGWELRVDLWTDVVAPAAGTVTFAGQVGGTLNVVIQHEDGVRTTLSKLDEIDSSIQAGMAVSAGQRVGEASGGLYFGARCGASYIDPALLFDLEVYLVPLAGANEPQLEPSVCTVATATNDELLWVGADKGSSGYTDQPSTGLVEAAVNVLVEVLEAAFKRPPTGKAGLS
jgi:murein DD-endopeptidase MepM/ murein hydrolase activator NlpD